MSDMNSNNLSNNQLFTIQHWLNSLLLPLKPMSNQLSIDRSDSVFDDTSSLGIGSSVSYRPEQPLYITIKGKRHRCYVFSNANKDVFLDWWKQTTWYKDPDNKNLREKINLGETQSGTSTIWTSFEEGAIVGSGKPSIICLRCDDVLTHPYMNQGTGSGRDHLKKKSCKDSASMRGMTQLTLGETIPAQVRV